MSSVQFLLQQRNPQRVADNHPHLVRAIGRWSLAALMLNTMIGSSIFGLPSLIASFGHTGLQASQAVQLSLINNAIFSSSCSSSDPGLQFRELAAACR